MLKDSLKMDKLREQYKAIYGNDVPNRYKNNENWIKAKIEEKKFDPVVAPEPEVARVIDPMDDIDITKPEVNVAPVNAVAPRIVANTPTEVVQTSMASSRDSYEGIQAFHGFSHNEAFLGQLERYKLNDREKAVVDKFINNKTNDTELNNLNYVLFKDWVKPIIEMHGLTSSDIIDEETLTGKIYESYMSFEKTKVDEDGNLINITPEIQANIMAKSKEEAQKVASHNTMLKNDLKRKDKKWSK